MSDEIFTEGLIFSPKDRRGEEANARGRRRGARSLRPAQFALRDLRNRAAQAEGGENAPGSPWGICNESCGVFLACVLSRESQ